jgi:cell division inhibitor SepF
MASMWRRTMVYLGLVDDEEYDEYQPYDEPAPAAPPPAPVRRTMRPERPERQERLERLERSERLEPAYEPEPGVGGVRTLHREESSITLQQRPSVVRPISPEKSPRVHVVAPTGFNDAQEIGDKLKANQPVIVNLQGVERDLSRRLIDFASGVTYGLAGQMERVADQVFLLTPSNVEVSAEEKRRLQERGLYRT